jgi:hypothetical protein
MSIWDDDDALYMPKRRKNGAWGVYDKASEEFIDGIKLSKAEAKHEAMRANDANFAAENATW